MQFKECGVSEDNIALFFFAKDIGRLCPWFLTNPASLLSSGKFFQPSANYLLPMVQL